MKQLLVLMLILGTTCTAGATLTVDSMTIGIGETKTISIGAGGHANQAILPYGRYLEVQPVEAGTWGEPQILLEAGPDAYVDAYWLHDPWWEWYLAAISYDPDTWIYPGVHFTIDFTGTAVGTATANLYDIDFTFIESITVTVVPEPITVLLLGFGGMAVVRRRNR